MAIYDLLLTQNILGGGDIEWDEVLVNISKGDLLSANSGSIPTVLDAAAGDDYALVSDSNEATGMKWISWTDLVTGGIVYGTDNQIPYMNGTDAFQYSASLIFNDTTLILGNAAELDHYGRAITLGADASDHIARTDSTDKSGYIRTPHYTNSEEEVLLIAGSNTVNDSIVIIGGGSASHNASTAILFYTAVDNVTTLGTNVGSFQDDGLHLNNIHELNVGVGIALNDNLIFSEYGSGTYDLGGETWLLAVDGSGNVIEVDPADYGQTYIFGSGLTETAGTVTLGGAASSTTLDMSGSFTIQSDYVATFGSVRFVQGYGYSYMLYRYADGYATTNGDAYVGVKRELSQNDAYMQVRADGSSNVRSIDLKSGISGMKITDSIGSKGIVYAADYSTNGILDDRWIPDYGAVKAYADSVGVSLGTDTQIPYMNGTTDFAYSDGFTFDDGTYTLTLGQTYSAYSYSYLKAPDGDATYNRGGDLYIQGGGPYDVAGADGGHVIIKAGDARSGDSGSQAGSIQLIPGSDQSAFGTGNITFGGSSFTSASIWIAAAGTRTDVGLVWREKGAGALIFGAGTGSVLVNSPMRVTPSPITVGDTTLNSEFIIQGQRGLVGYYSAKGVNLNLVGGEGWVTGDNDGGDVKIYGGDPNGAGSRGSVYLGDGSTIAALEARTSEGNVVYYDTTTGLLTYGDGTGLAGAGFSDYGADTEVPFMNGTTAFAYDSAFTYDTATNTLSSDYFLVPVGAGFGYLFGDGDTYFYEHADDSLRLIVGTATRVKWDLVDGMTVYNHIVPGSDNTLGVGAANAFSYVASYRYYIGPSNTSAGFIYKSDGLGSYPADAAVFEGVGGTAGNVNGEPIYIVGGDAYSAGDNDGSSVYIFGGDSNGTGTRGQIYFGDGSSVATLQARSSEGNVVYYDTTTGLLTYGDGTGLSGAGFSNYGTDQQIPYMNGTTSFDYSDQLLFDDATGILKVYYNVAGLGAGQPLKLYVRNSSGTGGTGMSSGIGFFAENDNDEDIEVTRLAAVLQDGGDGVEDTAFSISGYYNGSFNTFLTQRGNQTVLNSGTILLHASITDSTKAVQIVNNAGNLQISQASNTSGDGYYGYLYAGNSGSTNPAHNGGSLTIRAGNQYGTGGGDGGNLYMYGGTSVSGVVGSIYLGTGAAGGLVENASPTHAVTYNTTTGLLNWTAVGDLGSFSDYGADTQIPYMNGTTDFQYSSNFTYDGAILTVTNAYISMTNIDFRVGSDRRLYIHPTLYNTRIGAGAGNDSMTGTYNELIGRNAGTALTDGGYNIAIGFQALNTNQSTHNNIAIGSTALSTVSTSGGYNVAVGVGAFASMSSGSYGVAIGNNAGNNVTGTLNVMVGASAGASAGASQNSVYLGYQAGQYHTGVWSTFVGYRAGRGVVTLSGGTANVGIGYGVLEDLDGGGYNTVVGVASGGSISSGTYNTILGQGSGTTITTGTDNVIIGVGLQASAADATFELKIGSSWGAALEGYMGSSGRWVGTNDDFRTDILDEYTASAGINVKTFFDMDDVIIQDNGTDFLVYENGSLLISIGTGISANITTTQNTVIGSNAANGIIAGAMGSSVLIGNAVLYSHNAASGGNGSVLIGYGVATSATSEITQDVMVGYLAGSNRDAGQYNVFIGANAGQGHTTTTSDGDQNVAIGYQSFQDNTTATGTVAIGYRSAWDMTTGTNNVAIGYAAMQNRTTAGSYNTVIGANALENGTGGSNVAIGSNAMGDVTTAYSNIAIGAAAARYIGGATGVVAIGNTSVEYITGSNNVGVGLYALFGNNVTPGTGHSNNAIGAYAGTDMEDGNYNVLIGGYAGSAITDGSQNTTLGYQSGLVLTTGSYNLYIGYQVYASAADVSYEFRLGYASYYLLEGSTAIGSQWVGTDYEFRTDILDEFTASAGINVKTFFDMDDVIIQDNGSDFLVYDSTTTNIKLGISAGTTSGTINDNSVSIGNSTNVGTTNIGFYSVALGYQAKSIGDYTVSIGYNAGSNTGTMGANTISIGYQANQGTAGAAASGIAIGQNSESIGGGSINIGSTAGQTSGTVGTNYISIGVSSNSGASNIGTDSISIGRNTDSTATGGIAIGNYSTTSAQGAIMIGYHSAAQDNAVTDSLRLAWDGTTVMTIGLSVGMTLNEYGINTFSGTAAYNLEVDSSGNVVETTAGSDIRFKKYISPIEDPIEKILALQGYTFAYNKLGQKFTGKDDSRRSGFIAQEVNEIFPEVVKLIGATDYLKIEYDHMVPLLAEGIKATYQKVESHEDKIKRLEQRIEELEIQVETLNN